jgi:LemA protein
MSVSVVIWVFFAMLVFWSMGAYNRLIRLRFHGLAAFSALEIHLHQYVLMVQSNSPAAIPFITPPDESQNDDDFLARWAGLTAAADQFTASLKMVHARPLNIPTMLALRTAKETLSLSWAQLRDLPPDLAGAALPGALQSQWEQVTLQAEMASTEFNRQVENYNEAIHQFPALLLAWVFGFKPAQPI